MLSNWAIKQHPLFKIKGWQIQPVPTTEHTWPPCLLACFLAAFYIMQWRTDRMVHRMENIHYLASVLALHQSAPHLTWIHDLIFTFYLEMISNLQGKQMHNTNNSYIVHTRTPFKFLQLFQLRILLQKDPVWGHELYPTAISCLFPSTWNHLSAPPSLFFF